MAIKVSQRYLAKKNKINLNFKNKNSSKFFIENKEEVMVNSEIRLKKYVGYHIGDVDDLYHHSSEDDEFNRNVAKKVKELQRKPCILGGARSAPWENLRYFL